MNTTQMTHIDMTFQELRQNAATAFRSVYTDIEQQLKSSSNYGLSGEIAQLEAKKLNQELLRLTSAVKQAAIAEMISCGCEQYLTQAGWTEIQQVVGLPRTELCKVKVDTVRPSAKDENKEIEEMIQKYSNNEKSLLCGLGIGGAAVIVSLFIPGWALPVRFLCIAGATVMVLSGGGAVYCDYKKKEAISKFEHVGTSAAEKMQQNEPLDSLLRKIVVSQYERNLKLFDTWLEEVKRALISECNKLSAL